jgi:hypothetical protein
MDIEELQKKYEGTGISALSAMVMLEDANVPTLFQLKLDPTQELDWLEDQIYSARKFFDGINRFEGGQQ